MQMSLRELIDGVVLAKQERSCTHTLHTQNERISARSALQIGYLFTLSKVISTLAPN